MDAWIQNKSVPNNLVAYICWHVWIERNKAIFEDHSPSISTVILKMLRSPIYKIDSSRTHALKQRPITFMEEVTIVLFEGVATLGGNCCSVGYHNQQR